MTINELVEKLLQMKAAGKGDYEVIASTQDGACYGVDSIEEGTGWIEFS